MQKLLILLTGFATLHLAACSTGEKPNPNTPRSSWLESIPIVYRPDIQQGNIITQEAVNRLEPGLSKRQVRFIMGTPLLVDVFHPDRWDYVYTLTEGWGDREQKRLSLYFENDRLVQLEGDYRPDPEGADQVPRIDTVVSVPDYEDPDAGILTRAARSVTEVFNDGDKGTSGKAGARIEKAEKQVREAEAAEDMSNRAPGSD